MQQYLVVHALLRFIVTKFTCVIKDIKVFRNEMGPRLKNRATSPGGGGTPLYKPYRYLPPHRVGFLRRCPFWSGIRGLVFEGTTECMNVSSFQFQMSKKEREMCEFETYSIIFFVPALI